MSVAAVMTSMPHTLRLERPLVSFDLETTGLRVDEDRIVEISCVKISPSGEREIRTRRLNPGVPISLEASEVHGIYDADVKDEPTFEQVSKSLWDFLANCDLTGFNLESFDLPMLRKEFERVGLRFPVEGTRIVDSRRIFTAKEPRTLSAAYTFYCGKELAGAHSAEVDALAAADVLLAQIGRYDDLPTEMAELEAFCKPAHWVDRTGKLIWRDGVVCIGFGKYRNHVLEQLSRDDRGYLEWMAEADFADDVVIVIKAALNGEFPSPAPKDNVVTLDHGFHGT